MTDDIYSMPKSGFHEAIRQAKEAAWDEGSHERWAWQWRDEAEPLTSPYRKEQS